MSKTNALKAIQLAIDANVVAKEKLEAIIGIKDLNGLDSAEEQEEILNHDGEIGFLEELLAECDAAAVVVSAPTEDEIAEVSELVQHLRDLVVRDAIASAARGAIIETLEAAKEARSKVAGIEGQP